MEYAIMLAVILAIVCVVLAFSIREKAREAKNIKAEMESFKLAFSQLKEENGNLWRELKSEKNSSIEKSKEIENLKKDVAFFSDIRGASRDLNIAESNADISLEDLDDEQKSAFDLMINTNENMFITGKAGTGKSALLSVFSKETIKTVLTLAPTGIAAMNVRGVTIHSAFGYNNLVSLPYDHIHYETLKLNSNKQRVLEIATTIIIDEISMVRADILEKVDRILKAVMHNDKPFGGKQMILFGDLFQLPPIASKDERLYLNDVFGGIHFFNSFAYKNGGFKFIELTVNHRQNGDERFFGILNDIRDGTVSEEQLDVINERASFDASELRVVTRLFSKKADAEAFNKIKLNESIGREFISKAKVLFPEDGEYPVKGYGSFEMNFPVTENLKLKKGSLVMFVKNNGDKWANGTIGIVSEIRGKSLRISVNKEEHDVFPTEFEQLEAKYENGKIAYRTVCIISQYPIVLAYAMTIHKSQGQTYGKIACDVSDCFAPGQAYVALSRVKALSGLFLLNKVYKSQIHVDTEINDFYNRCILLKQNEALKASVTHSGGVAKNEEIIKKVILSNQI